MNKKYVITGLTCSFLLVTGICYSCSYNNKAAVLTVQQSHQEQDTADLMQGTADPEEDNSQAVVTFAALQDGEKPVPENTIYVHICGAVKNPGVYPAGEGDRLIDVITLSGGLTEDAAGDYINQAQQVTDGQRIYIPSESECKELSAADYLQGDQKADQNSDQNTADTAVININTADTQELMSLPGIGEAKANSIINYRNRNGKFKAIEELMDIPGIKEGLFNQISSLIIAN